MTRTGQPAVNPPEVQRLIERWWSQHHVQAREWLLENPVPPDATFSREEWAFYNMMEAHGLKSFNDFSDS